MADRCLKGYNFSVQTAYKLQKPYFEGPLDLLLDLIEKRKLFINDISLSEIADDYIAHVERLSDFPVSDTANFVLIASTLVLIKSKSLLPTLDLSDEEKGSIEDLELRLRIYKEFRDISKKIGEIFGKNIIFSNVENKKAEAVFAPTSEISLEAMQMAMADVLKNLPKKEEPPKTTVKKIVSLEEMMDNLASRIQNSLRLSFKNFTSKEERLNAIVGFLAMLELVKRGVIAVRQDKNFADIEMEHSNPGIPDYR